MRDGDGRGQGPPCQASKDGRDFKVQVPRHVGAAGLGTTLPSGGSVGNGAGRDDGVSGVGEGAALTVGSRPPSRWVTAF